ncbi:MAG: hypothetical protein PHX37_00945 [Eubacteriales bacterium]|nr:hypothetical protein [Eubacteriales bacterium]
MKKPENHEPKWYKLDNAAKIYPVVVSAKDSYVFRITANMKDEVRPDILQQAVNDCRDRFPAFYVKLRRGLFWYYYEANEKEPLVKPEPAYVCRRIDLRKNNGFYFTHFYYKKRISIEIFHGICDGAGALEFFKTTVYRYLELLGLPVLPENLILTLDQKPEPAEAEDSYNKYYSGEERRKRIITKAYKPCHKGFLHGGAGLIVGKASSEKLHSIAREKGVTVTQYLTALLSYCYFKLGEKEKLGTLPVKITIPVNMRRYCPSTTLRNFSLFFHTSVLYTSEMTFESILEVTKKQFISELTDKKLRDTLNSNVVIEKNIAVRFLPLFIKKIILKTGYKYIGTRSSTATVTNLGNIELPNSMMPYVIDFELNSAAGKRSNPNLSLVSYNDITTLSFSRGILYTGYEKLFFSFLAKQGLKIEVQSNLWEDYS